MSIRGNIPASSGTTHSGALLASLTAAALACVTVIGGGVGVINSVARGGIGDQTSKTMIDELVSKHDDRLAEYRNRFDGRRVFFPPPVQRKIVTPAQAPVEAAPVAISILDRPPVEYVGPPVAWAIGEEVYFAKHVPTKVDKYIRLRVGDETDGVMLLDVSDLPNTVRVRHRGGEYDVKVFGRNADTSTLFEGDLIEPTLDGVMLKGDSQ